MKLTTIPTGYFKLDGGAMFGVVPKKMWQKLNPPDENNLCTWAMRTLLVQTDNRKILIDTGIGTKQDAKFRSHFEPTESVLLQSLAAHGVQPEEITDVLLTHLHFDHVGGAIGLDGLTFPEATYWSNEKHWNWAMQPNEREKASFLKENFAPLKAQNRLQFIDVQQDVEFIKGINIHFTYGHTEAMMLPIIQQNGETLVFCADTMPAAYHIPMPYVMAYDIRPLQTLEDKAWLLEEAVEKHWTLFFEHDPTSVCGTVKRDDKGRIVLDEAFADLKIPLL
jgi:glyoxylase-like metal-dependent hydrolase (beta-lactamase superfamily II)